MRLSRPARSLAAPMALAFLLMAGIARPQSRTALDIGKLSTPEAIRGEHVTLRAVVTFVEPGSVIVQDETGGTYVRTRDTSELKPGDEIQVSGRTEPGNYMPGIAADSCRVLNRGALPKAAAAVYEDLLSGRCYYERIAVEGVVRSVAAMNERRSLLRLAAGSNVIEVWVEQPLGAQPTPLVDALVTVSGVALGSINNRRQLVQPYMRALGWSEIEVLRPAVPDAAIPRMLAGDLLTYHAASHRGIRVRLAGTVLLSFPHGMLYLRGSDTAFAVRLKTPPTAPIKLGDRIEVIGFPEMARYSASLVDAQLISRQPGPLPEPIKLHLDELFLGQHECDLVEVSATVTDSFRAERERALVLKDNERRVRFGVADPNLDVPVGSTVRVVGISRVVTSEGDGYNSRPETINLYARDSNDLEILQRPSAWTVRRLTTFVVVLGGAILFAALWIALLRRQVRRQAAAVRAKIESEAALAERHRLAREFHDTLEQELTGLGLRLDAVGVRTADVSGRKLLGESRNLVSRIQLETRNLIADLRHPSAHAGDLGQALLELTEDCSAPNGPEVRLAIEEPLPALPVAVVHNLRMMVGEAVTNALKHAGATDILVKVEAKPAALVLTIADNGSGFDPSADTGGRFGHFGRAGMKERAARLGATVTWHSAHGAGTRVEVQLPSGGPAVSALA